MKKHGIAQDNPSFPSDDKDKFPGSLGYGGGHALWGGPSNEQDWFFYIYLFWPTMALFAKSINTMDAFIYLNILSLVVCFWYIIFVNKLYW